MKLPHNEISHLSSHCQTEWIDAMPIQKVSSYHVISSVLQFFDFLQNVVDIFDNMDDQNTVLWSLTHYKQR